MEKLNPGPQKDVLRLARSVGCLHGGGFRLGCRLLRPFDIPGYAPHISGLAHIGDLLGDHLPLPNQRGYHLAPARPLSAVWSRTHNSHRSALIGSWRSRLGISQPALAPFCCRRGKRHRMGTDEWSRDQRHVFISLTTSNSSVTGETAIVPLGPGEALPSPPPDGLRTPAQLRALPGVQIIPRPALFPGPTAATFAFGRSSVKRNLYELTVQR